MARYPTQSRTATISSAFDEAKMEIESLQEEMEEWRENIEEHFSETDKYQRVSDAADALQELVDNLPEEPERFGDMEISWTEMRSKRGLPRWARLSNALGVFESIKDALEGVIEEIQDTVNGLDELDGIDIDFPSMFG